MNLINAYQRVNSALHRQRYNGRIVITYELLAHMLELPEFLRIRGVHRDYARNCLDIIVESDYGVPGITFPVEEGTVIPQSDIALLPINNQNQ